MKSTKIKTKTEKGITLIALIITIVVLLILAVVAINSIQNDGIISHAANTAETYNQAVKNEQQQLQEYLDYLNGPKAYKKGDKVKLKNDSKEPGYFYVLADSDETKDKVTLVTNLCINTDDPDNIVQSTNPTSMAFIEGSDWRPIEGWTNGYLYDGTGEPDSTHIAAHAAYKYGASIGGFGRLLSAGEVDGLPTNLDDKRTSWTGTFYQDYVPEAGIESYIVPIASWEYPGYWYAGPASYSDTSRCFVRPVIEISKNLIKLVEE